MSSKSWNSYVVVFQSPVKELSIDLKNCECLGEGVDGKNKNTFFCHN